jgi:general secretion pathway protein J
MNPLYPTRSSRRRRPAAGFTLIELLVAMAILAVVGVLSYNGTHSMLAAKDRMIPAYDELQRLESLFLIVGSDIELTAARSIRDQLGGYESAIQGGLDDRLLVLTRYAPRFDGSRGPDLKRIEYVLQEGKLIRRIWPALDRIQAHEPFEQVLAEGIATARVRFFDQQQWKEVWPAALRVRFQNPMPSGIEFSVLFDGDRSVRRIYLLGSQA